MKSTRRLAKAACLVLIIGLSACSSAVAQLYTCQSQEIRTSKPLPVFPADGKLIPTPEHRVLSVTCGDAAFSRHLDPSEAPKPISECVRAAAISKCDDDREYRHDARSPSFEDLKRQVEAEGRKPGYKPGDRQGMEQLLRTSPAKE